MPETAFVAGATGYTGREVVRVLREAGVRTIAHVRPDSSRLDEWRARFAALGAEVDATPWVEDAMKATLATLRPTSVFSLLGTTRSRGRSAAERGAPAETYETVDWALTAMLIDAAAACGSSPVFVYLSSTGVKEDTKNAYLAVRWRAEEKLRASGLPHRIARPSFVTGPDRDETRLGERAGAATLDAVASVLGAFGAKRLGARYRSTDAPTLAAALVRIARDGGPSRNVESEDLR